MNRLHFFSEPKLPQGHKLHFFIIFCYYNLYSSCSTFGINYTKLLTMRVNYNPKPKNGLRILNHFSSFHGFYKLFMLLLLKLLSLLYTLSFAHCTILPRFVLIESRHIESMHNVAFCRDLIRFGECFYSF